MNRWTIRLLVLIAAMFATTFVVVWALKLYQDSDTDQRTSHAESH